MYIIIGNSPRKVELKDLGDCVYYKQQKIYTDSQYESSEDLKKAIERKDLLVLKKVEENKDSSIKENVVDVFLDSTKYPSKDISNKIDLLLEKMYKLEECVKQGASPNNDLFFDIINRIEKIEKNLTNVDSGTFKESIVKENEEKLNIEDVTKKIIDRLETLLNSKIERKEEKREIAEDVYVPNIVVEDANSNIKLEVRAVENSDNITESLRKLKELKSKSK